ncbi:MAG: hypothetical protein H7329_09585 [Opitutaceae bacterium]|nr:hypothetical protein [Cytophagales bacterium]
MKDNLVIAHRGTTFWAPEETEAAMRWARNTGADYLEFDLQRTKDGKLIALHDNKLDRTTNVAVIYPDRKDNPISDFTYLELLKLDAGSWFNREYPDKARPGFKALDILTLEDIIQIAEGKRICRDKNGKRLIAQLNDGQISSSYEQDPKDNGNRPGLYIETKLPELFPGIENDLKKELSRLGWYCSDTLKLKNIPVDKDKIAIANTKDRIVLQTFSLESLGKLNICFAKYVPKCILLWRGNDAGDILNDDINSFRLHILKGKENGATIAGPSISGKPNNYTNLLTPVHFEILKKEGFKIHAYSFDSEEQFFQYHDLVEGMFTNQADETLRLSGRSKGEITNHNVLKDLGY